MGGDRISPDWDDAELFRALVESAPDATVVADATGRIVLANRQAEHLFGYSRAELLGGLVDMLVPVRYRSTHPEHRARYLANPRPRPMGSGIDLFALRKDGSEFAVEISLSPVTGRTSTAVALAIRDVTSRNEKVRASLREKDLLLKEIHHRVKNNLQITLSMLKLQSAHIRDPAARELFAESQNRIRSMALVHEKLYRASELARIDLADYTTDLASLLFRSFGVDRNRIRLEIRAEPVYLSIETAIPCGLILNELLTNCFKHAFPDGRTGTINVEIRAGDDHHLTLVIRDDGVGLPADLKIKEAETLGLEIVNTLVDQLQAQLEVVGNAGTEVRIHLAEGAA